MSDSWILKGARVADGPNKAERLDLEIRSGKIAAIGPRIRVQSGTRHLNLHGCLILPGLINAHDHLEFNLFPRLGKGPYPNSGAWARDIYHPDQTPVREHLRIPLPARLRWGAVKNLLSGVTTVCHHNPYHPHIFSHDFAIRVPKRYGWAHSFQFSSDIPERFRQTPRDWPFVLHLGEAVDRAGRREIQRLDEMGVLDHRTVLVHAVALGRRGLLLALKKGASIVWCPSSNIFILGQTLTRLALESRVSMALGTDSALSGKGNLLDEVRFARRVAAVPAARLYAMVTNEAARVMRLGQGEGTLKEGGIADFLVVRDRGESPAATLLGLRTGEMEMVFVGGRLKLVSPESAARIPPATRRLLHPLIIGTRSSRRVYVALDLPSLFQQAERILGSVVLAHTRMLRPA